jgi:hypothetical protein
MHSEVLARTHHARHYVGFARRLVRAHAHRKLGKQ